MAERKSSFLGVSLRAACYLTSLFYFGVFLANFVILFNERLWEEKSDEKWIRWQWVDATISGISILAALLLLIAIVKNNYHLLAVFVIWAILCIVLSIVVLSFGFGEYDRGEIVTRCIGIAVTAYFIDVVFSFYLNLKNAGVDETTSSTEQPFTVGPNSLPDFSGAAGNGGFHNNNAQETERANTRNVRLWYENTKV